MQKKILKKKINKVAVFISDEGFGHSVRQKTIISEFLKHNPKIDFTIFNSKRLLFLKEYFGNRLNYQHCLETLHTIKKKNGELDIFQTKKILTNWPKKSNLNIKKILSNKQNLNFDIIISDLVPESFRLAQILNIPAYGVARFSWDWFFLNTSLKNLKEIQMIKDYLQLSKKIYFSTFIKKKILSNNNFKFKAINLIFNKNIFNEGTNEFFKSSNKYKCLIMDNGTKTNSILIQKTVKYLNKMPNIDFYISVDNFSDKLKLLVAKEKNLIPIQGLKNMHNLISYVDFLVARGGYNTITEILIFKKPALLINEKKNPEVKENLIQMKKLDYCSIMEQSSFKLNFPKTINSFIKNDVYRIEKNLKKNKISCNGSSQIVRDIILDYEKN
ncbi:hypothetical protein OAM14_00530 [Candidatus Pelagibacter sp.]|nr:hypothetical protein [Candidatus Pelagibacter sp.]